MTYLVGLQLYSAMQQIPPVFIQQFCVFVLFPPVQPHDGIQILELPLAPLIERPVYHGIVIPGIDEQHLIQPIFRFALIEEP